MFQPVDCPAIWPLVVLIGLLVVRQLRAKVRSAEPADLLPFDALRGEKSQQPEAANCYADAFQPLHSVATAMNADEKDRMIKDKELYLMLQNIEDNPGKS